MGKELPASHYTGQGYLKKRSFERYMPLYKLIASLLPPPDSHPEILDLGCGIGYFAKVLYDIGYRNYLGIDFSKDILDLAKKHMPHYEYKQLNLYSPEAKKLMSKYKLFTMIETLEHIDKDISVLKSLPKKSTIIGSVPSGMSAGHVRCFSGIPDVENRYSNVINFDFFDTIRIKPKLKAVITIFRGTIK